MDAEDRITRLESALIDLAIVVSEGHLSHLGSANISADVVQAGQRLQQFHEALRSEHET